MNSESKKMRSPGAASEIRFWLRIGSLPAFLVSVLNLVAANSNSAVLTNAPSAKPEPPPTNSREFFNVGSRKLREGKLPEAEAFLQSALARQDERVRPRRFTIWVMSALRRAWRN